MADDKVILKDDPAVPALVFVTVQHPFQVAHHGIVFGPGDTAQVPEHVAAHWIRNSWVVPK
jgi:hypothetical protein